MTEGIPINFSTELSDNATAKLNAGLQASQTEAQKLEAALKKAYEAANAPRLADPRAGMAADQAAWEAKKAAMKAPQGAAAGPAKDDETLAKEANAAEAEHNRQLRAMAELLSGPVKQGFKEAEAGHKAGGEAAGKHGSSTRQLYYQMRALNGELGRVPELSAMLHVLRHPFTLAAVAVGLVIAKLKGLWDNIAEFENFARAGDRARVSLFSLRAETEALAQEDETFIAQQQRLATAVTSVADAHRQVNEAIARTKQLQMEALDAEMEAERVAIETSGEMTPAQKTVALAQLDARAKRRKDAIEDESKIKEVLLAEEAAEEALARAEKARADLKGAEAEEAAAMEPARVAASVARESAALRDKYGNRLVDLKAGINYFEREGKTNVGLMDLMRPEGRAIQEALSQYPGVPFTGELKQAKRIYEMLRKEYYEPFDRQASLDKEEADRLAGEAQRLAQRREQLKQVAGEGPTVARGFFDQAMEKRAAFDQEYAAREARRGMEEGSAKRLAQFRAVEQTRSYQLEYAQLLKTGVEASMAGGMKTKQQKEQLAYLDQKVAELQHPYKWQGGIRELTEFIQQLGRNKEALGLLKETFEKIGPAAFRLLPPLERLNVPTGWQNFQATGRLPGMPPASGPSADGAAPSRRVIPAPEMSGPERALELARNREAYYKGKALEAQAKGTLELMQRFDRLAAEQGEIMTRVMQRMEELAAKLKAKTDQMGSSLRSGN